MRGIKTDVFFDPGLATCDREYGYPSLLTSTSLWGSVMNAAGPGRYSSLLPPREKVRMRGIKTGVFFDLGPSILFSLSLTSAGSAPHTGPGGGMGEVIGYEAVLLMRTPTSGR